MTPDLFSTLHCPYCGSGFNLEFQVSSGAGDVQYGILRCACYRYPIVDGIPILRQCSGPADTNDVAVGYLEARQFGKAFHHVFYGASPIRRRKSRWQRAVERLRPAPPSFQEPATFREGLQMHRPSEYATYLLHRTTNNSFLAAIPLLLLLKDLQAQSGGPARMLDLNCGVGHASYLTRLLFPEISVIAADHDFVNLYLARKYLIPDTPCICLDAELPLPFAENFFSSVLCLDGLHYVRSKKALLKELDRILEENGLWLFPHLHNALGTNVSPGVPLSPAGYRECFDFLPMRIYAESEVLRRFMKDEETDLSKSASPETLNQAPVLSLVASRNDNLWRNHAAVKDRLLQIRSNLIINPIYRRNGEGNSLHLRMAWPSPTLERECETVKEFLPQTCDIDSGLLTRLRAGALQKEDQSTINTLIKSFVLVPLPENYT